MKKELVLLSLLTVSLSLTVAGCDSRHEGGYYQVEGLTNTMYDCQVSMGYDSLYPIGDVSVLVVPVQLKNEREWTEEMLNDIDIAFFGKAEETNYWESVASYYEISSYGQLHISGEVTDPFYFDYTKEDFLKLDYYGYDAVESYLIPQYNSSADIDLLQKYDTDNNGHVDAVMFIYSNDYTPDGSDDFWAWCWYRDVETNLTRPTISTYMWASYSFIHDGTDSGIDSHTYIHEFGHILGLDDYYGGGGNYYNACGALEMQSYNVGDQSSVTKLQLGWINPIVIDGSQSIYDIPLRSSALYPDAILINDEWTGGAEDEYLLIEYYTPEGNNKLDSEVSYMGNSHYQMYTDSGLRIYHVDARLAKINPISGGFRGYSDQIYDDGYMYYPAATNISVFWSYLNYPDCENFKLSALMQANVETKRDSNHFANGGWASNGTLYHVGQSFAASSV
ncbi:MAG: hypothetical protein LUD22_01165, partial [Coprobacillus sp.]|nr:hypothetical protein [Coprobacillus sp.]